MAPALRKSLQIILPLALGAFFIYLSLYKLTDPELDQIKDSFLRANYWWVGLGVFLGFLSHVSRAIRWNFMLEPMGYKPRLGVNICAIGIGYLLNLVIPRSGEIARCAVVNQQSGVPLNKAIGTVIAERVADFLILIFLIVLAFALQFDELMGLLTGRFDGTNLIVGLVVAVVVFSILLFLLSRSKNLVAIKIKGFLKGILEGIKSIGQMEQKWAFISHTIFIWAMYLLMFYVCIFAIPETSNVPISGVLAAFVVGSLAVAFTNGGLGAYPLFIAEILLLFGIEYAAGTAFGWIVWTSQTFMILIYGGISFMVLPKKVKVPVE